MLKSQQKDNESRREIGKGKEEKKYYCNSDDNEYNYLTKNTGGA